MPDKNDKNKAKLKQSAKVKHDQTQDRKHESPTEKNDNQKNGSEKLPELTKP